MDGTVTLPRAFLARLMAAIETPGDLTEQDVSALLEDADSLYRTPASALERGISAARELRDHYKREKLETGDALFTTPILVFTDSDDTAETYVQHHWGYDAHELRALQAIADKYDGELTVFRQGSEMVRATLRFTSERESE